MSEPTVTVVKDGDGNVHHFSSHSKKLLDGLADGTYRRIGEAKPNEAQVPADSGDLDTGASDSGPRHGGRDTGVADGGDVTGEDQPVARGESRKSGRATR